MRALAKTPRLLSALNSPASQHLTHERIFPLISGFSTVFMCTPTVVCVCVCSPSRVIFSINLNFDKTLRLRVFVL